MSLAGTKAAPKKAAETSAKTTEGDKSKKAVGKKEGETKDNLSELTKASTRSTLFIRI